MITRLHKCGPLRWEYYYAHPERAMVIPIWWKRRRVEIFTFVLGRIDPLGRRLLTSHHRSVRYQLITLIPGLVTIELRKQKK